MKYALTSNMAQFCVTCVSLMIVCMPILADSGAVGVVTCLSSPVPVGQAIRLIVSGSTDPISVPIDGDTLIVSNCRHCNMAVQFKAKDVAKKCSVCPCETSFRDCTIASSLKPTTWQTLLRGLPKGVALRVTYVDAEKPENGLKSLSIDMHSALIPVEHIGSFTPARVLELVKPIGILAATLEAGGSQLLISVKEPWTGEREKRLERAIADVGGRVNWPEDAAGK